MTVRVYKSSDASAPALSGQAGALAAIFYACLVTGYGSATAAGWAREFVSGNIAVFRAATGNRLRLRLDDTSTNEARIVGYETMSDANTGTGAFPTNGQVSGGLYVRKSNTADAVGRPWLLIATGTAFYFFADTGTASTDYFAQPGPTAANSTPQLFFGDFTSFKAGDAYNTAIICSEVGGTSTCRLGVKYNPTQNFALAVGHYVARPYYQVGQAVSINKVSPMAVCGGTTIGNNGGVFPDPLSGALLLSPVYLVENGPNNVNTIRGILPGFWDVCHFPLAGNHGDTVPGSGESSGKTFQLLNLWNASSGGRVAMEISDTW